MIFYLTQPYSSNPLLSFELAKEWTAILREKGFYPFSPILHSHPFHEWYKKNRMIGSNCLYTDNFNKIANETMKYIELDLALLKGWCVFREYVNPYGQCEVGSELLPFQPNVIMLLSKTAFNKNWIFDTEHEITEWYSEGCQKEYEFAKENHIRVLELEAFLKGKEVEL